MTLAFCRRSASLQDAIVRRRVACRAPSPKLTTTRERDADADVMDNRTNLVGRTSTEICELLVGHVDHEFRGRQVAQWIIDRNATGFAEMTDLPVVMRRGLEKRFSIEEPEVLEVVESSDGAKKYLFALSDGANIEGVSMRDGLKATFCVSSQAGCAVGCTFCVTGAMGGGRNLLPGEIVGQYRAMLRRLEAGVERINIVFMGMGEPLLNTTNLGPALAVLSESVSLKRITVSTVGILPGMRWLAGLEKRPKLAVSLNAPDQKRRESIIPIARRYSLDRLIAVLRDFPLERGRRITFEYVLIDGFNDAEDDADATARLIRGIPSKVNVIPLNEDRRHFPNLRRPSAEKIDRFATCLRDAGLTVTVRWSRGGDVAAACGQLQGRVPVSGSGGTNDGPHP
jgi:23S rRNA (adenine2503-C2)-methyltransferase